MTATRQPVHAVLNRPAAGSEAPPAARGHWPEYLMEGAGLGLFMVSACSFALLLFHPGSPVASAIEHPLARRVMMGLAMGLTAVAIVYSPWGKQSGAHLNPALTLTFYRLGKVSARDLAGYGAAHLIGGLAGAMLMAIVAGSWLAHPAVNYVVTVPGEAGAAAAFVTEFVLSFLLMFVVLSVSNSRHARWTGACAGLMVAANISAVAPLSGMSMNPARSLASAVPAHVAEGLWIYFTAPPLAMLLAAQVYLRVRGPDCISCAKLHHQNDKRCIFCEYHAYRPVA